MDWIKQLKVRLQEPLPGLDAQAEMLSVTMHKNGRAAAPQKAADNAREAAVMLLLFVKNDEWHTALMQRPETPYPHSRQISFPGGGVESHDVSFEATALRETQEEFGIHPSEVEVLGALTPLYIPVSNYLVYPYVGYMTETPSYTLQPSEVEEVIEIPLREFLAADAIKTTTITTYNDVKLKGVPYFDVQNRVVWGATSMMLNEFMAIAKEIRPFHSK